MYYSTTPQDYHKKSFSALVHPNTHIAKVLIGSYSNEEVEKVDLIEAE
jgi:hypothetical protein